MIPRLDKALELGITAPVMILFPEVRLPATGSLIPRKHEYTKPTNI